jgi:hypothetical protein
MPEDPRYEAIRFDPYLAGARYAALRNASPNIAEESARRRVEDDRAAAKESATTRIALSELQSGTIWSAAGVVTIEDYIRYAMMRNRVSSCDLFRSLPAVMTRTIRNVIVALILTLSGWNAPTEAKELVDLLLVLAADVSHSVDANKFKLQREGYAAAFGDPRVINAISSGLRGRIAVCFVEWSGAGLQRLVIDWTVIEDFATGKQFGDQLLEIPRSFANSTSISGGIDFALAQFAHAPFDAERRTIDVSGDGNNNNGRDVHLARDEAVAAGVTINGLVILTDGRFSWSPEHTNPPGGLEKYYRDNVIGGPGAFVLVAKDFNSFGDLLIRKLIAEIALVAPRGEILPP